MERKEQQPRPGADVEAERPSVDAEEEAKRTRRQVEGPAPGAPRSVEDRAVERANEWKDDERGDAAERSPPGGTQR